MKFIGITGGVGAGKSVILSYIREHYNAKVVLADDLAKTLMLPDQECYQAIRQVFDGYDVFAEDGTIEPRAMAAVLFSDDSLRQQMNHIVHPAVKRFVLAEVKKERERGNIDYYFFESALLIEDEYDKLCDEMWYIFTSEENRRARLKAGRGYSDDKISSIFASQMSEATFREHCKVVIDNNGTPEEAVENIRKILG